MAVHHPVEKNRRPGQASRYLDYLPAYSPELNRIERQTGAAIIIETIDSLNGESADQAAIGLARRSGIQGFFILIARKEHR